MIQSLAVGFEMDLDMNEEKEKIKKFFDQIDYNKNGFILLEDL